MIFVTFGNGPLPFTRLAARIDELAKKLDEEIVIQHGHTEYYFNNISKVYQFLPGSLMSDFINNASLIISHGGYGTISECLKKGKIVIAVPRNLSEANHLQEELVRALETSGYIIGVYNIVALEDKIDAASLFQPRKYTPSSASSIINEFIRKMP